MLTNPQPELKILNSEFLVGTTRVCVGGGDCLNKETNMCTLALLLYRSRGLPRREGSGSESRRIVLKVLAANRDTEFMVSLYCYQGLKQRALGGLFTQPESTAAFRSRAVANA